MSHQTDRPAVPKAVIHKRILDAAADQPEASLTALASNIPAATADLVEKVLDDYGDPAGDEPDELSEPDPLQMAGEPSPADLDGLSESERETLRAIAENPDATQSEIADALGVSRPTVSNRVNGIEGFDWAERQIFVETLFETRGPTMQEETTEPMATNNTGDEIKMTQLAERVENLEEAVEDLPDANGSGSAFDDPDLLHRVVHACLKADSITEEEELQILKRLL